MVGALGRTRVRATIAAVAVVSGCTAAPATPLPEDAGTDAPAADATVALDAHFLPVVEVVAAYSFGRGGFVSDAVATVEGEVCIAGVGAVLDALPNDAFVACYGPGRLMRFRRWPCQSASRGATRLAARSNGDLYVALDEQCTGVPRSQRVERLDRGLETLATFTVGTRSGFGPDLQSLAVNDRYLVIAGALRGTGAVGGLEVEGPTVVVVAADDLHVLRVVGVAPDGTPRVDVGVRFAAIRDDDEVLLFGRDVTGGALRSEGGTFVRAMHLPDGAIEPAGADGVWHHQYGAAWHPDGRPVVLGTQGDQALRVGLGDRVLSVELGYAGAPHAAFRGDELLIARPFFERLEIADRTFTSDELGGGVLVAVRSTTLEPLHARDLPPGYRDYLVQVTGDSTFAVIARDPVDPRESSVRLTMFATR